MFPAVPIIWGQTLEVKEIFKGRVEKPTKRVQYNNITEPYIN